MNYIRLPDYFKLVTYKYLSEKSTSRAEQLNPDGNLSGNETKHKLNAIAAFLDIKYFLWLKHMVIHLFGMKHTFLSYPAAEPGVYQTKTKEGITTNTISIAVTADWATYSHESARVIEEMAKTDVEYTIHLGDTYYSGETGEIEDNFTAGYALWHRGHCGSFALMGNHEMYSKGAPYFNTLLPTLGVKDFTTQRYQGQKAAYFCLQTDYWNIIGIDTGYNSVGFPFFMSTADCRLEGGLMDWLTDLKLSTDSRGIILLSHHQYYSAYEEEFYQPAEQLKPLIGNKSVIWIWGHEHKCAVYGKWRSANGINAYGRCIGNGGIPVELNRIYEKESKSDFAERAGNRRLVICDKRMDERPDGVPTGYNGYATIELQNEMAVISNYSVALSQISGPVLLLQEHWMMYEGNLTGYITQHLESPDFFTYNSQSILNAVV